ncbi:P1 family peptidase [Futiania mangrovi]|uniref:P1 family peptidase n=1 Tax=Futiania mangrovi TaxID=2959716 RepID=A0A9J6PH01_9PROT|nr:P1 family peptidase [Futiania mangrovii]MCP1337774.1 P1 family peptidase [Futiania mangrovii]
MAVTTGPRNLLTDVAGLKVGNAEDLAVRTGVTAILPDTPVTAAVDVRGGAPGTRETDALDPSALVDKVHGIVLSGGSVYGLDAASAAVSWLGARGVGYAVLPPPVPPAPVVPGAILFDLANGGDKAWGSEPPYRRLGIAACEAAGVDFALGSAGAGAGAMAGTLKGGLGSASLVLDDGTTVAALIAGNPVGSAVIPGTRHFWAWPHEREGEFGGLGAPEGVAVPVPSLPDDTKLGQISRPGAATVIGVVATDADLTPAEARRLAMQAHSGLSAAVWPAHTPLDGDTLFALATGARPLGEARAVRLAALGAAAAACVARALARGVYEARALGQERAWRDLSGA